MRSVLAGVENVNRQHLAELDTAEELQRRADWRLRRADRHVLVIHLVGAGPTRSEVGLQIRPVVEVLRDEAGVVVFGFVIVPGDDPRDAA
jgi:prophage tail gpP-like protein